MAQSVVIGQVGVLHAQESINVIGFACMMRLKPWITR